MAKFYKFHLYKKKKQRKKKNIVCRWEMANEERSLVFKQNLQGSPLLDFVALSPDFLLCAFIIHITARGLFVIWIEKEIKK